MANYNRETIVKLSNDLLNGQEVNHLETAKLLYHPSKKVETIVTNLITLFDTPLPNGVKVTEITFEHNALPLCGLQVKSVEREDSHCAILVHWYPNYSISTTSDPFCSAFILKYNSLQKLYKEVKKAFDSFVQ